METLAIKKEMLCSMFVDLKTESKFKRIRYNSLIPYLQVELIKNGIGEWKGRETELKNFDITTFFDVLESEKELATKIVNEALEAFVLKDGVTFSFSEELYEHPNFRNELLQQKTIEWFWTT